MHEGHVRITKWVVMKQYVYEAETLKATTGFSDEATPLTLWSRAVYIARDILESTCKVELGVSRLMTEAHISTTARARTVAKATISDTWKYSQSFKTSCCMAVLTQFKFVF